MHVVGIDINHFSRHFRIVLALDGVAGRVDHALRYGEVTTVVVVNSYVAHHGEHSRLFKVWEEVEACRIAEFFEEVQAFVGIGGRCHGRGGANFFEVIRISVVGLVSSHRVEHKLPQWNECHKMVNGRAAKFSFGLPVIVGAEVFHYVHVEEVLHATTTHATYDAIDVLVFKTKLRPWQVVLHPSGVDVVGHLGHAYPSEGVELIVVAEFVSQSPRL